MNWNQKKDNYSNIASIEDARKSNICIIGIFWTYYTSIRTSYWYWWIINLTSYTIRYEIILKYFNLWNKLLVLLPLTPKHSSIVHFDTLNFANHTLLSYSSSFCKWILPTKTNESDFDIKHVSLEYFYTISINWIPIYKNWLYLIF